MKFPEAPWEKEWREFEEDHLGRPRPSSYKGGEMETLKPNGDLIFEGPNDGYIIYGKETSKRLTSQELELRNRRVLCHEDDPYIVYKTVEGGTHGQARNNG